MTDQKRPYRMKRRAEQEAETRLRITESAVELHGTLGPARTSVSAVAERAGVRRSTVYRHFPDEAALFGACSAHWMAHEPAARRRGVGGDRRTPTSALRTALAELYAYYRRTEEMLEKLLRDAAAVPVVDELMDAFRVFLDGCGRGADAAAGGPRQRAPPQARRDRPRPRLLAPGRTSAGSRGSATRRAAELMSRFAAAAG